MCRRPQRVIGLPLLAGVIVFFTMTLTLGEISRDVINRKPLTITDAEFSHWLHARLTPSMTTAMFAVTSLGSTLMVSCIAAILGLYLISRRRYYWFVATMSSVFGGMLLNKLLKYAFQRQRPFFNDPLLTLTSYSFPSGHTMMATVLYGVMAAYFLTMAPDWWRRALILLSAILLIATIGFSRVYLGAHYLSDVVGAMAEGLAWLSLCLTATYSLWRRRKGEGL
jgi:membrane-associated phospholipid phosphatase